LAQAFLIIPGIAGGSPLKAKSPPVSRPIEMRCYPFMASQKPPAKNHRNAALHVGYEAMEAEARRCARREITKGQAVAKAFAQGG
jgi:hypothetical protein